MGTWICHLRVAEQLLEVLPDLDEPAFVLGSLAPDSGIPNADWTQFDPPKTITHYLHKGEDEGQIRDLLFYRDYLAILDPVTHKVRYSFLQAYYFHLLCDALWSRRIGRTTKLEQAALITQLGINQAFERIKDDWYGLDQRYVRDHPDCIFWRVLMKTANPPAYLFFLPPEALNQQLDYIRTFYSRPESTWILDRPYPYLNEATMQRFVQDCATALIEIHHMLQASHPPVESITALDLLEVDRYTPYPAPLGDALPA